jgi:alpha-glucosidase
MLGKGSVLLGSALFGAAALASSSSADLVTRQAGKLDACPGYAASNVVDDGGRVTADLALAGTACNAYGDDLTDLKLEVEYQTGLFILNCSS